MKEKEPLKNPLKPLPLNQIASLIDHTLLKIDATHEQIAKLCQEARQFQFAGVCVLPHQIAWAASELKGSPVLPIAAVGLMPTLQNAGPAQRKATEKATKKAPIQTTENTPEPTTEQTTWQKIHETQEAVRAGAREIDMLIHLQALREGDYKRVIEEINAVKRAAAHYPVKLILETAALTDDQKVIACALAKLAEIAYVKTSTGFGPGGATVDDIKLMRAIVGKEMGVKASGGIRSLGDAQRMIEAGATRIGTSAGVAIMKQTHAPEGQY